MENCLTSGEPLPDHLRRNVIDARCIPTDPVRKEIAEILKEHPESIEMADVMRMDGRTCRQLLLDLRKIARRV